MIVSSSFASSALLRPVLSSPPPPLVLGGPSRPPLPPPPGPGPAQAQAQAQADVALHGWCDLVGIPVSPSVRLRTTPESVAGRGVFSVLPLREGEVVARIRAASDAAAAADEGGSLGAAESPSATYPLPSRCSISNRLWPETVRFDLLKLRFVSENRIEKTVQDAGLAPLFVNFCTRLIYNELISTSMTTNCSSRESKTFPVRLLPARTVHS